MSKKLGDHSSCKTKDPTSLPELGKEAKEIEDVGVILPSSFLVDDDQKEFCAFA